MNRDCRQGARTRIGQYHVPTSTLGASVILAHKYYQLLNGQHPWFAGPIASPEPEIPFLIRRDGTEHSEDDAIWSLRRKRRRVSAATCTAGGTAPQQQICHDGDSRSRDAQRSSQHPKRRHRRRSCNRLSSQGSTSDRESETDEAPVAKFEEWPLGNAVLKRVTMGGAPPTFVVQFTWDPCANHGQGTMERAIEAPVPQPRDTTRRNTRDGVRATHIPDGDKSREGALKSLHNSCSGQRRQEANHPASLPG